MIELTITDVLELLFVGILASALNFAVVQGLKKAGFLSKSARRLAPTAVGMLVTLPGLPVALVWLTPLTWDQLAHDLAVVALIVLGLLLSVANAGGAQWCHAIVRTVLERIGERAPDFFQQ